MAIACASANNFYSRSGEVRRTALLSGAAVRNPVQRFGPGPDRRIGCHARNQWF